MSHRTEYETLLIRDACSHDCFKNYRHNSGDEVLTSACGSTCGCGGTYRRDHAVLLQKPTQVNYLSDKLKDYTGKKTWLFVLDFFDDMNFDIFEALAEQKETPLTVEGCVATFYKNYMDKIHEMQSKGIVEVWFGVESGSQKLRESYTKPFFTNDQLIKISDELHRHKIRMKWYLTHGPEDTRDTTRETNELVRRCNPTLTWFSLLIPGDHEEKLSQTNKESS